MYSQRVSKLHSRQFQTLFRVANNLFNSQTSSNHIRRHLLLLCSSFLATKVIEIPEKKSRIELTTLRDGEGEEMKEKRRNRRREFFKRHSSFSRRSKQVLLNSFLTVYLSVNLETHFAPRIHCFLSFTPLQTAQIVFMCVFRIH